MVRVVSLWLALVGGFICGGGLLYVICWVSGARLAGLVIVSWVYLLFVAIINSVVDFHGCVYFNYAAAVFRCI